FLRDLDDPVLAGYRGLRYDTYADERTAEPFIAGLLGGWRAQYDEPFRGLTADGRVRGDLYATPADLASDPAARMAAERVLRTVRHGAGSFSAITSRSTSCLSAAVR